MTQHELNVVVIQSSSLLSATIYIEILQVHYQFRSIDHSTHVDKLTKCNMHYRYITIDLSLAVLLCSTVPFTIANVHCSV